jgi:hypothetical protein
LDSGVVWRDGSGEPQVVTEMNKIVNGHLLESEPLASRRIFRIGSTLSVALNCSSSAILYVMN